MTIDLSDSNTSVDLDLADKVSIYPVVKRGAGGEVLPSKCRLDVEVVPDVDAPGGYTIKAKTLYASAG